MEIHAEITTKGHSVRNFESFPRFPVTFLLPLIPGFSDFHAELSTTVVAAVIGAGRAAALEWRRRFFACPFFPVTLKPKVGQTI